MKDLEFHVDLHGSTHVFKTFKKAIETAVIHSINTGKTVNVDVLTYNEAAAQAFGGDSGVESYREDPEASVFHRIAVRDEDLGRVP